MRYRDVSDYREPRQSGVTHPCGGFATCVTFALLLEKGAAIPPLAHVDPGRTVVNPCIHPIVKVDVGLLHFVVIATRFGPTNR